MKFLKQSHSAEKLDRGDSLGFLKPVSCKISKNLKGGPFGDKKISKKKSHSAEKNCSKKFLAKARTRTRDRWVHRKPSTDEYM